MYICIFLGRILFHMSGSFYDIQKFRSPSNAFMLHVMLKTPDWLKKQVMLKFAMEEQKLWYYGADFSREKSHEYHMPYEWNSLVQMTWLMLSEAFKNEIAAGLCHHFTCLAVNEPSHDMSFPLFSLFLSGYLNHNLDTLILIMSLSIHSRCGKSCTI